MSTEDEQLYKFLLELVDIKDSLEINDSLTTTNFVSDVKEFLSDTNGIYNENIIIKYLSIKDLLKFITYYESQKYNNVKQLLKDFVELENNNKIRNNIHLRFLNNLLQFEDEDISEFHKSLSSFRDENYNNVFLTPMFDIFFPTMQNSLFLLTDFLQYYKECKEENDKLNAISLFEEYRKDRTKNSIDFFNKLLKITDRTKLKTKIEKLKQDKKLDAHLKRLLDILDPSNYRESLEKYKDELLSVRKEIRKEEEVIETEERVEKILKRNKGLNVSRKKAVEELKIVMEEDEEEKDEEKEDEEESDKEIDFEVEEEDEDGGKIYYEEDDTDKFKNPSGMKFKNVDDVLKYYKDLENQTYVKPLISWVLFKKDNPKESETEEYNQIVNFLINNNQNYTVFSLSKITKFKKYNSLLLEETENVSSNVVFVNLKEGEYKPWNTFLINGYEMLEKFDVKFFSTKVKLLDPEDVFIVDYIETKKSSFKEEREVTNCDKIFTDIELIREWIPSNKDYPKRDISNIKMYIIEKSSLEEGTFLKKSEYYNKLKNPINYGSLYYRANNKFIGLYCDNIKTQSEIDLIINESEDKIRIFEILYIVIVKTKGKIEMIPYLQNEDIFNRQQELITRLNLPKEELYLTYINDIKFTGKQLDDTTFEKRVKQVGLNRLSSLKNKEGNNTEMIEMINNSFYEKSETLGKYALYISRLCIFFENWNKNSIFVSRVKSFDYNPINLIEKQPKSISNLIKEYSPEINPSSYEETIQKILETTIDNVCLELYSSIKNSMGVDSSFYKTSRPVIPGNVYKNYLKNITPGIRVYEEDYKNKESVFEYDQELRPFQFEGIENMIESELKRLEGAGSENERINRLMAKSFGNLKPASMSESSSEYSSSEYSDSE